MNFYDGNVQTTELGNLTLALHTSLVTLKPAWQAFEPQADCTPFQSLAWLSHSLTTVGSQRGIMPVFVALSDATGLLMILPLQIEQGALRQLSWLANDLNDYNAPVIAKDYAARATKVDMRKVWHKTLDLLATQDTLRFKTIRLEKMPERIGSQPNPMLSLRMRLTPSHAYRTHMGEDWERYYLSKRSTRDKSNDRYRRKKLTAAGEITLHHPKDKADILQALDLLISLKSEHLKKLGIPNFLQRPGYVEFFRKIACSEPQLVHVSQLKVGETVVATNLGLTFREAYYSVITTYISTELSKYSPGGVHLQELMRWAMCQGITDFDFTIGDEAYKLEWSDEKLPLFDHLAAPTLQGKAALIYHTAFHSTKRYIKQNPALWTAYCKLRKSLGKKAQVV